MITYNITTITQFRIQANHFYDFKLENFKNICFFFFNCVEPLKFSDKYVRTEKCTLYKIIQTKKKEN